MTKRYCASLKRICILLLRACKARVATSVKTRAAKVVLPYGDGSLLVLDTTLLPDEGPFWTADLVKKLRNTSGEDTRNVAYESTASWVAMTHGYGSLLVFCTTPFPGASAWGLLVP